MDVWTLKWVTLVNICHTYEATCHCWEGGWDVLVRGKGLDLQVSTHAWMACHFCSYFAVENKAHFVLKYNPIRDEFSPIFENIVLESLRYFFQLDNQLDITLYLMDITVLCHSRKLAVLKPP